MTCSTPMLAPSCIAARSSSTLAAMVVPDTQADSTLMLRYRNGDVQAFEQLYTRHKAALYRYLQRMCSSRDAANDVFQEVWSKLIDYREQYQVRAQFKTFLFRIAHHCAVDELRRAGRHDARYAANQSHDGGAEDNDDIVAQLPAADHEQPEAVLAAMQLSIEFQQALTGLPAEQREVFLLYEESRLSLAEISQITGVNMETAKSRLRYALHKLRATLKHHQTTMSESIKQ